jgi:hypothetical protein
VTLSVVLYGCETLSDTKDRTYTEDFLEQGSEENI